MATDYSWIGPLIGAVGGYLGSRNDSNTTTSTQQLPAQFQPLAAGVAQRGIDIGNMPYQGYSGPTTAGFTPYQFAGMDQIAGQALGPQTTLKAADSYLGGLLGGQYLGSNPYVDAMAKQTAGDVTGRMNSGAFSSGSFGNAGVAEAGARGIAKAENDLRFGAYESERNRMQQGLGAVPAISQAQYMPGQQLMGIGGVMQQQGQNQIDANMRQFEDWRNWPFKTYDAMMAPFGRNIGGSTTTQGPAGNPVAGMLGGAMLGGRMQSAWGSGQQGNIWSPTYDDTQSQWGGWTGQR